MSQLPRSLPLRQVARALRLNRLHSRPDQQPQIRGLVLVVWPLAPRVASRRRTAGRGHVVQVLASRVDCRQARHVLAFGELQQRSARRWPQRWAGLDSGRRRLAPKL